MKEKKMKTETASLILTNLWQSVECEKKGEIMKTDVFIKLISDRHTKAEIKADMRDSFLMFCEFAARFTRFETESELSRFNVSEGGEISSEFFSLLEDCAHFYELTDGVFDPSILPILETIGYAGAKNIKTARKKHTFNELVFDEKTKTVCKPRKLFLDLGGIGKGYIVDKVADRLSEKYANGIVDAGGDMRIFGGDREQDLEYFAIDVENPFDVSRPLATLLLSDCAVATSGVSRKHWKRNGKEYHHIIDPSLGTPAQSGLNQVTVIAKRATEADVFAKTLFILGLERGQAFASEKNIPAFFVTDDHKIIRNHLFQKYEWQA
jgi:thiamine biosynthesis lipoprotein